MKTLIVLLFSLAIGFAHADVFFRGEGIEMRLMDKPCTHPKVLALLRDEWIPKFQQGRLNYQGRELQMCWTPTRAGHVAIVDEDGDAAEVPTSVFKKVTSL